MTPHSKARKPPVTFLAIASIETEGDATKVDPAGTTYGIVQISRWYLDPYNCNHHTNYKLADLIGQGQIIKNLDDAVNLSFDLLGQFMITFNNAHNSYRMTATAWNGTGCGWDGVTYLFPWTNQCGGVKDPASWTCYGQAAVDIAASHPPYWIDPRTGQPNSF